MRTTTSFFLAFIVLVPSVAFADTSIQLIVEGPSGNIYSGALTVTPCPVTDDIATTSVSAKCALEQAGLNPQWSNFGGDDWFLTTAGGTSQDFANNLYWGWWSNLAYGDVALNKHELIPDESLLIALGVFPLRIDSPSAVIVGATTTITIEEFGFDSSFSGVWTPSANARVDVNATSYSTDSLGTLDLVATSTDPLVFSASKSGFVPAALTLIPMDSLPSPTPISTTTLPISPVSTGGGGGGSTSHKQLDVSAALAYLASQQQSDGSFGALFLSGWAALAFATSDSGGARAKLASYLTRTTPTLSSITDYERHAMALMALGINPYSGAGSDYITPIVKAFDGTQIGDIHLDNDDIFALFPLLHAGYTSDDLIIKKTVAFILSAQQTNGSWDGSVDMTAAAIQSLAQVQNLSGVTSALGKARAYLHSQQGIDGGFGNSFATSWTLQAITALGDSQSSWSPQSQNPKDALATFQQNDGGIEPLSASVQTRVWATAYTVPATQSKTWDSLLTSFPLPSGTPLVGTSDASPVLVPTATSTLSLATSTRGVASTSLPVIVPRVLGASTTQPALRVTQAVAKLSITPYASSTPQVAGVASAQAGNGFFSHVWGLLTSIASFFTHLL